MAPGQLPLNILVVDDEDVGREMTGELLKSAGHHVMAAKDGAEAVERVARRVFDLVLMDIDMPVMDGFAATRAIRALPSFARSVKIVALTARTSDEDRRRATQAGMDGFVTKPFRLRHLEPWIQASARPL